MQFSKRFYTAMQLDLNDHGSGWLPEEPSYVWDLVKHYPYKALIEELPACDEPNCCVQDRTTLLLDDAAMSRLFGGLEYAHLYERGRYVVAWLKDGLRLRFDHEDPSDCTACGYLRRLCQCRDMAP